MTSKLSLSILVSCLAFRALGTPALGSKPWINELHYDNAGTDVAEFVEIAVPTGFAESAAVRLTLYNGGDGRPYGSPHTLDTFNEGQTADGFTLYWKAISGLQNGAPDGMALDIGGAPVDFISYEGSFAASAGPAVGWNSRDLGVFEPDTNPSGGALGGTGIGDSGEDFLWQALAESSPGQWNSGQFVVPEPRPTALILVLAAGLTLTHWRRRHGSRPHSGTIFRPTVKESVGMWHRP
jgi:hypothetical protein